MRTQNLKTIELNVKLINCHSGLVEESVLEVKDQNYEQKERFFCFKAR